MIVLIICGIVFLIDFGSKMEAHGGDLAFKNRFKKQSDFLMGLGKVLAWFWDDFLLIFWLSFDGCFDLGAKARPQNPWCLSSRYRRLNTLFRLKNKLLQIRVCFLARKTNFNKQEFVP